MQTRIPLILTARIADDDLVFFDELRKRHFPPDRNFLSAHLTMFHRLPGEYKEQIISALKLAANNHERFEATISNVRHLGAGVAFDVHSAALSELRALLRSQFASWLGPQDKQKWQPHITVQNKVSKTDADHLYEHLSKEYRPATIMVQGVDLWRYLNGPWRQEICIPFGQVS